MTPNAHQNRPLPAPALPEAETNTDLVLARSDEVPLARLLDNYLRRWPEERDDVKEFQTFLSSSPDVFRREHPPGHFTASCWLVSADGERLLMTHHRKLTRWLQLGGHCDGDTDVARSALREAEEESGLAGLGVEPGLFDIDRHSIPARGSEPAHWHYDLRFVIRAGASEIFAVSDESHALAWRDIRQLIDDPGTEPSIRRMAHKWLAGMGQPAV